MGTVGAAYSSGKPAFGVGPGNVPVLVDISADLAVHYVRAGWLVRLARGVFSRPNDAPALHPSLVLLQRRIEGLHVGGKSALDWHGVRQYVSQQPLLHLYGWEAAQVPDWFAERLPCEYHRKRLFDERPHALLHVGPFEQRDGAPRVSSPERALLELLIKEEQQHYDIFSNTYQFLSDSGNWFMWEERGIVEG